MVAVEQVQQIIQEEEIVKLLEFLELQTQAVVVEEQVVTSHQEALADQE
jgi:hypothetical protein